MRRDVRLRVQAGARRAGACRGSSSSRRGRRSRSAGRRSCPCRSCTARSRSSGFGVGPFAYLTDCSADSRVVVGRCSEGVRYLVLDALRDRPHPTHFTLVRGARGRRDRLRPERALLTHICHDLRHAATSARLPAGVELAYDGLRVEVTRLVDVIHFPDDPRPAALAPAGAGARQLRRAAPRPHEDHRARRAGRRRARRDAGGDDVRSAPDARRPARQGAAAADDARRRSSRRSRGPACTAWRSCASRRDRRAGSPRRSSGRCSSTGCAWPRCGWARTSCSATIGPGNFSLLRLLGARVRLPGREDRPGPLQGLRGQQHAHPPAGRRGARGRGRRRCSGTTTSSTAPSCTATRAGGSSGSDRQPGDGQRAAAAPRRLRDDGDPRTRRSTRASRTSASGRRSAPALPTVIETYLLDFDRDLYGPTAAPVVRAAAAGRAHVRRRRRAAGAD